MAEKPDPEKPADHYSEEETDRRMGAPLLRWLPVV